MSKRLGIVISHPIQYYAPMFKAIAAELPTMVYYCHNPSADEIGKSGFGKSFQWDIDLLDGYPHRFLENKAKTSSVDSFWGCNCPEVGQALKEDGITHLLILGWHFYAYWQAFIYARRNGIKLANRGDSILQSNKDSWKGKLKRMLYPLFLSRYDRLFYVGERNKAYLEYHGAKAAQLAFAPHAVDQDFWKAKAKPNRTLDQIAFIWVAKFMPLKRPFDLIAAFQLASKKDERISLRMVGSGELLEEAKKKANGNSKIEFPGFKNQTELRESYEKANVLILNSDSETWGLVVNEAMAMGLPAITTEACGCHPDMIDEGETGYVVQVGAIEELAQKMLTVAAQLRENPDQFNSYIEHKNQQYHFKSTVETCRQFLAL